MFSPAQIHKSCMESEFKLEMIVDIGSTWDKWVKVIDGTSTLHAGCCRQTIGLCIYVYPSMHLITEQNSGSHLGVWYLSMDSDRSSIILTARTQRQKYHAAIAPTFIFPIHTRGGSGGWGFLGVRTPPPHFFFLRTPQTS